jgi:hypothetical protein
MSSLGQLNKEKIIIFIGQRTTYSKCDCGWFSKNFSCRNALK